MEVGITAWTGTYALLLEALDNGEGAGVVDVLHDEPVDRLAVIDVDAGRLDQLGLDTVDRVRAVVCVEVHCDCVDHVGRFVCSDVRRDEAAGARVGEWAGWLLGRRCRDYVVLCG